MTPVDGDTPLPGTSVTADELRARAEAQLSYKVLVVVRWLIGRPLRRYPPPSWTPLITAVCVAVAAGFAALLWWLYSVGH